MSCTAVLLLPSMASRLQNAYLQSKFIEKISYPQISAFYKGSFYSSIPRLLSSCYCRTYLSKSLQVWIRYHPRSFSISHHVSVRFKGAQPFSLLIMFLVLSPGEIVNLQLVSHRLFQITRDNNLWRSQCFESSSWEALRQRREFSARAPTLQPLLRDFTNSLASREPAGSHTAPRVDTRGFKANANERIRIMANWDPSYPDEKIDWYSEFIHRSGPISVSWLQQPQNRESTVHEPMEIRGVGTYNPPGDEGTSIVVGPLDDGSICLWDVSRSSARQGKIIGRSSSSILFTTSFSPDTQRSRMINTGVIECVSVDNHRKRAYVAVQSGK
jgi:hypothetical protein